MHVGFRNMITKPFLYIINNYLVIMEKLSQENNPNKNNKLSYLTSRDKK